jgi:hypothetical protein
MTTKEHDAAQIQYSLGSDSALSFSTSFTSKIDDQPDRHGLSDREGFWSFGVGSPARDYLPNLDLELGVGGFDWETGRDFGAIENRMMRVNASGKVGSFSYGLTYASFGDEFSRIDKHTQIKNRGEEIGRLWMSKSFGNMSAGPFVKRSRNIPREGRNDPLVTDMLIGGSLDYTWFHWPYIGTYFSYGTGTRESAGGPAGVDGFETGLTSVAAGLNLSHDYWSANLSIDRMTPDSATGADHHGQPAATTYYLGGSLYPNKAFSVTPSISITDEHYDQLAVKSRTLSSSLSLSFSPEQRDYRFSAYASYDTSKSVEWNLDTRYLYSELGVHWDLGRSHDKTKSLSLMVVYDDYQDAFFPGSSAGDFSVRLVFRSFSLDGILRPDDRWEYNSVSPLRWDR